MSPTVFRDAGFRFYFFSKEETRPHVHVVSAEGEAKFWMEPAIEIAESWGLSSKELRRAQDLIEEHENEIRDAWTRHFGGCCLLYTSPSPRD